jgi:DNA ligase-1
MTAHMKPWLVVQELERENSKNHKLATIEVEAFAGNDELFEGLMLALHPHKRFGVKQVPDSTVASTDPQELDWDDFKELCRALHDRELTGHAARDAIHDVMLASGQEQWDDWFRRILIQDMRAGFTESTVNKAVKKAKTPQYEIPVFKCMLAHDSKNHEKKVCGKKQIEVKLDGVRVLTIMRTDGTITQHSRNGRELKNFGHTKDELRNKGVTFDMDMVLDGEIMSSNFQDLMTQVNRQSNVDAADAVLNVFDIIPLAEFEKGVSTLNQVERSEIVRCLDDVHGDELESIRFLRNEIVDLDSVSGIKRYAEINRKAIEGGYEGIMLKDIDAPYYSKRHAAWLKLKPVITVDLKVVGREEGTGKHEGMLGAIVCEGTEDGKFIKVNVGSGLSDEQRAEFWTDDIIGNIIEVKADAITQSRDADDYSLRFPRFVRFRGFEDGEKI